MTGNKAMPESRMQLAVAFVNSANLFLGLVIYVVAELAWILIPVLILAVQAESLLDWLGIAVAVYVLLAALIAIHTLRKLFQFLRDNPQKWTELDRSRVFRVRKILDEF